MIGKEISMLELEAVLRAEGELGTVTAEIEQELTELEPGKCLVYKFPAGKEDIGHISINIIVKDLTVRKGVKGLRAISAMRKSYVLKEK